MFHIIHVQIHVKRTKFFETANLKCILAVLLGDVTMACVEEFPSKL